MWLADEEPVSSSARIIRLAARSFDPSSSKPSSSSYTTRKVAHKHLWIGFGGVQGDYNHYRAVALANTATRAVSLVTVDVMNFLRESGYAEVRDGDLGENLLIEGMKFDDIRIGDRYRIGSDAELTITEAMIPCANLCKLHWINRDRLKPRERLMACQDVLTLLDGKPGLRGWYAEVTKEGNVKLGATVDILR